MSMRTATALFFDLDGTLAHSERHHWAAWREVARAYEARLSWQWYRTGGIGTPDLEIARDVTKLIGQAGRKVHPEELLRRKEAQFLNVLKNVTVVPLRTIRLLENLRRFPLALVTSCSRVQAEAMMKRAGIARFFQVAVCLEDVRRTKPDPEPYRKAMKALHVRSGIAFEDSESGVASARAAGLQVVVVPDPGQLPDLVAAALAPDRMASHNRARPT
jgi:beta-phosphoglucomutase